MQEMKYEITVRAPLGDRTGMLCLRKTNGALTGWIELMRFHNEVRGVLLNNGECRLTGEVRTLLRPHPFEAEGTVGEESAELELRFGHMRCRAAGSRVRANA